MNVIVGIIDDFVVKFCCDGEFVENECLDMDENIMVF